MQYYEMCHVYRKKLAKTSNDLCDIYLTFPDHSEMVPSWLVPDRYHMQACVICMQSIKRLLHV